MKRRFHPFLNEDRSGTSDTAGASRLLAARQAPADRATVRRPEAEGRRGAVPRIVPAAGLGLLSLWLGCLLLLDLAVSAADSSRSAAPVFSLREATDVDGEGIFLDQIVTAEPPVPLPHLRLAAAPTVGQVTLLARTQVVAWIQTRAPAVTATQWNGPDRSKITRRTRSLEELELRDMLRTVLQRDHVKDRGELELRLTRAWANVAVADEPLTLKVVDLPTSGVGANFIVRFELFAGEERLGSWQVAAAAKVWREILVAESPVKRGQLLRSAALTRERRDVLALRDPAVAGVDDEAGELEFRENVMAGQPIYVRSLRVRPVVHRGSIVDGMMFEGGMTITLKVEVLEDGLPGHVVRVRNPRTRREMLGKVKNEQTIVLPM